MLIDEVNIVVKGGHGGTGSVSFRPGQRSGPDGGNGGRGGDVYITGISDLTALNQFSQKRFFSAENGMPGQGNQRSGSDGQDLIIRLPVGTEVVNKPYTERVLIEKIGQKKLICKGGLGGRGNFEFRSPRNTTPTYAQKGLEGEGKNLYLILKIIADFGLIGLPNAGKSSLLNELTKAQAKVGDYPFTTLEPNLGVLNGKVLADIPGLIEGASEGKGLGIKFLKHIEKVKLLLHCISTESDNVVRDYEIVVSELKRFNQALVKKGQIILLTKSDLADQKRLQEQVKSLKKLKHKIIPISIHDWDSLQILTHELH